MKSKKEVISKLSTKCRKCGKEYSVNFKGKVAGMLKAETELDRLLKNCGCDIKKIKGFNEDESSKLS